MKLLKKLSHLRVSRYFKLLFIISDLVLLNIAIALSGIIVYGSVERLHLKELQTIFLLSNLIWLSLLLYNDSYRIIRIELIESMLKRTSRKILIHASITAIFVFSLNYSDVSRRWLAYFYVFFFLILMFSRYFSMKTLGIVRAKGYNFRNFVIVGANDAGEKIHKVLAKDLTYGYRFLGFFDERLISTSNRIIGGFDKIEEFVLSKKVDEMYVTLHIDKIDIINKLIQICDQNMVRIKFVPDFQQYTKSSKVKVTYYQNTPILRLHPEPLENGANIFLKKIFDVVFSLFVILFIFPWLFPIIIIIIKLESPGPVFFKQERSGLDNISFSCLKFRSMYVNTTSDSVQARKKDARITKFGAFMRKTSIDELPQFFNVLMGDMSVVGPRPHMLKHTTQYRELISNYLVRHYTKPGITGWAQVNGYRGETKQLIDMKNRVEYDIWYVENWSLLLDLRIILKTLFNIFSGEENAY